MVTKWKHCQLEGCPKQFVVRRKWAKYCSNTCKVRAYLARRPQIAQVTIWNQDGKIRFEVELEAKYITEKPLVLKAFATSALVKETNERQRRAAA